LLYTILCTLVRNFGETIGQTELNEIGTPRHRAGTGAPECAYPHRHVAKPSLDVQAPTRSTPPNAAPLEAARRSSVPRSSRIGTVSHPHAFAPGSRRAARQPVPHKPPCRVPLSLSRLSYAVKAWAAYKRHMASSSRVQAALPPAMVARTPSSHLLTSAVTCWP
jgi:hypothetical protein